MKKPPVKQPNLFYEQQSRLKDGDLIAGVDEAGRGALAGPVTAAAVILPKNYQLEGLNDSKKVSPKKREFFFNILTEDSRVIISVAHVSATDIDQINILCATHQAMKLAIVNLSQTPHHCLIDGLGVPSLPVPSTALVKGDQKSLSIAAASIIAKVTRDRYLVTMDDQWPRYGFKQHKGYGTKTHLEALRSHGPCPQHRQTFQPVAECAR